MFFFYGTKNKIQQLTFIIDLQEEMEEHLNGKYEGKYKRFISLPLFLKILCLKQILGLYC